MTNYIIGDSCHPFLVSIALKKKHSMKGGPGTRANFFCECFYRDQSIILEKNYLRRVLYFDNVQQLQMTHGVVAAASSSYTDHRSGLWRCRTNPASIIVLICLGVLCSNAHRSCGVLISAGGWSVQNWPIFMSIHSVHWGSSVCVHLYTFS